LFFLYRCEASDPVTPIECSPLGGNIESSHVSDTSRIKTAYQLGKLISSTDRKYLKPVTIQYLLAGVPFRLC